MTHVLGSAVVAATRAPARRVPIAVALARWEVRRLSRHPILLVAFAYLAVVQVLEGNTEPRAVYSMVTGLPSFLIGSSASDEELPALAQASVLWLAGQATHRRTRRAGGTGR